jgi:zinc protease
MTMTLQIFRAARRAAGIFVAAAVLALAPAGAEAVEIQRIVSEKGVEAWFVRDRSVPIVSMSFSFKGGNALDPAGKEGLAEMVSGLLDEGAGDLDAAAYQAALKDISASVSFDAGRDSFGGSLRTLADNRDAAFKLLRLALASPRFDAEPIERIRAQIISNHLADFENPQRIAGRTWFQTVFAGHPYGRSEATKPESLKAVAADDLKRFAKERFARDNLTVAIVGDIAPEEVKRRIDEVFGDLPAKAGKSELPEAKPQAAGKTIVVRKPIPQSVVVFGENGVKRNDKDYYVAFVMNYILGGGGFASRLMEEVREKRGLAYSVYSYLSPMDYGALVLGGLATQNARVAQSLDLVKAEWRRMAEKGVSDQELDQAKTYINGSFPLRLDSSRSVADLLVQIQIDKLGIDYIDKRASFINAVTAADIQRVAKRLLNADKLTVVVVGDPEGVQSTP